MCVSILLVAGWFLELLDPSSRAFSSWQVCPEWGMVTVSSRVDCGEESDGNFADCSAGFWTRIREVKTF